MSCWNPFDAYGEEYDRAQTCTSRSAVGRPSRTVAYYRGISPNRGCWSQRRRRCNENRRQRHDDAFGIDRTEQMGAREAERLIKEEGIKGPKLHPTVQGFHPNDRMCWLLCEVINAHKLPVIFHTRHSGIGSGMYCGGKLGSNTRT